MSYREDATLPNVCLRSVHRDEVRVLAEASDGESYDTVVNLDYFGNVCKILFLVALWHCCTLLLHSLLCGDGHDPIDCHYSFLPSHSTHDYQTCAAGSHSFRHTRFLSWISSSRPATLSSNRASTHPTILAFLAATTIPSTQMALAWAGIMRIPPFPLASRIRNLRGPILTYERSAPPPKAPAWWPT